MTYLYPHAYFWDEIIPIEKANLSIASSAVLYWLSIYTVFPVLILPSGPAAFCLNDHYHRLINSAKMIGLDTFEPNWSMTRFIDSVVELIKINNLIWNALVRVAVHVNELIPGTRSKGLETKLSMFVYEAKPIISETGARLKTSIWRRNSDTAIPARAKVNGAYVNSVLGKQDALDNWYDDCLFLDIAWHVCELSAANIFIVRDGVLITPDKSNDILEGVNRKIILELAKEINIQTLERTISLTEVYIADEVFACGTSALIWPILEIDNRKIWWGSIWPLTRKLQDKHRELLKGENPLYKSYFSYIT